MRSERLYLGMILATLGGVLAFRANQPIVENYVGRQIPTAMVARNLDLGSGFLHPSLDTAPFPSLFLVEPPLYAQMVVGVKHAIGFVWEDLGGAWLPSIWEVAGRLTSAGMTVLGAGSLYGLVRRREGPAVALVAVASFSFLPVTLRYGRAFQPDATMLGFVLLGMHAWDQFEVDGDRRQAATGALALAVGLALKITVGWVLIPYLLLVQRLRIDRRLLIGLLMLVPALTWYGYAGWELRRAPAATENARVWLEAFGPAGWMRWASWSAIVRNVMVRAFTLLGFVLAVVGWVWFRPKEASDRFWMGWAIGVGIAIVALAPKWHHGYYWNVVAPLVAVGVGRVVVAVRRIRWGGKVWAGGLAACLVGLSGYQASSTWRTPPEWDRLAERDEMLPSIYPNWILIATEAVLFYTNRPGFRLEFAPEAVHRASEEWGAPISIAQARSDPLALVDLYERQMASGLPVGTPALRAHTLAAQSQRLLLLDIGPVTADPRRSAWRAAVRGRAGIRIWSDQPTLFAAELDWVTCSTAAVRAAHQKSQPLPHSSSDVPSP